MKDMYPRFGASKTISRQNYNMLGAGFGYAKTGTTGGVRWSARSRTVCVT